MEGLQAIFLQMPYHKAHALLLTVISGMERTWPQKETTEANNSLGLPEKMRNDEEERP